MKIGMQYAALFVLVSFLCSHECSAFDYDDNIGFMKNVPKHLRAEYPMCDEFVDVKWSGPMSTPGDKYIGKALIDVYEKDVKSRRGLLIRLSGEDTLASRTYVSDSLEDYHGFKLVDPSRAFVLGGEDYDLNRLLGVRTRGKDDDIKWISKWYIDGKTYRNHPQGYPRSTLNHWTRTICLASPEEGQVWVAEPTKPFVSDKIMSEADKRKYEEMIRHFDRECTRLLPSLKQNEPHWACTRGGSKIPSLRTGIERDIDGDGNLDYLFRVKRSRFFIIYYYNDSEPFFMRYPKECYKPHLLWRSIMFKNLNKYREEQQCVTEKKSELFKKTDN